MTDNPGLTKAVCLVQAAHGFSLVSARVTAAEAPSLMILYPVHVETQP